MKRQRSERRSPLLLTTLVCSCLSPSSYATMLPQHRVRRAHRRVEYRHVLEERTTRIPAEKFFRRNPTAVYVEGEEGSTSSARVVDYDEEEFFWHMQVAAFDPLSKQRQTQQKPQQQQPGYFRRLLDQFDQFINTEDVIINGDENNTATSITNVTASVELGNTTSNNNESSSFVYTAPDVNNDYDEEGSGQNQSQYQPLRIRGIMAQQGNGNLLTEDERNALFHDMLSPALLAWSSSLRVDPVIGNLTVDKNQLVDKQTCGPGIDSGLPSVQVPLSHLTKGIPDTDMIVYLSVGFVVPRFMPNGTDTILTNEVDESWTWKLPGEDSKKRDEIDSRTPTTSEGDDSEDDGDSTEGLLDTLLNSTMDQGSNSTNTTNTTTTDGPNNLCTGQHLAAASFCSTDQYDRPTAAVLHICIDETFFDASKRQRNIVTLMHELGHALGFNALSMAHFRRQDGTPITPRVNGGDIPDTYIECTGPSLNRRWANVALPSDEILKFREVRGGLRVAELVTPSVVQVVRNQFDCQPLEGAELESGEGLPLSVTLETDAHGCVGDHWERRLFSSDLMNPVVSDDVQYSTRISTLTMAYFADSGWYQVDLSNAEVAAGWGRGAGCSFANETCIGKNGEVPPQNTPFFCNDIPSEFSRSDATEIHGCTSDLSRKAVCSMGQYDLDLPWEYQYFHDTYGSDVGGSDALMDYCPIYNGFDNGACATFANQQYVKVDDVERFGQRNSRCLLGSRGNRFSQTALCLPIACVIEDRSLQVYVDRKWQVCREADQELKGGSLTVTCPDPRRICPTFYCPYDCLGTGGVCDYNSGKCLCEYDAVDDDITSTVLQVCRTGEDEEAPGKNRPILRPVQPESSGSVLPHPDSPLADYYVPTTRQLSKKGTDPNDGLSPWAIVVSAAAGLVFVVFLTWIVHRQFFGNISSIFRSEDIAGGSGDEVVINRNKDKMIASVLVDMRIRQRDESMAETEERMTESEVASSGIRAGSISDFSSGRSDSGSSSANEVDLSQDLTEEDIRQLRGEGDEELQDTKDEPYFIRRRRVTADCKKEAMMMMQSC